MLAQHVLQGVVWVCKCESWAGALHGAQNGQLRYGCLHQASRYWPVRTMEVSSLP